MKKKIYFTKDHENAIVKYASTEDNKVRTKLYIDWIEPAFDEMVDKIVYTYKFTNLPNIDCLKEECKSWLTTILDKFDPDKGSKAFSYFSVITKNWFIHKVKKNSRSMKREVHLDDLSNSSADYEQINSYLTIETSYVNDRENAEFWYFLWKEVHSWEKLKLKDNENKCCKPSKYFLIAPKTLKFLIKKLYTYTYARLQD